jgi:mRNA interferase MazF
MVALRGEIWWADLPEPVGSGPGFRYPVLVVQEDTFNESPIRTVIVALISTNMNLARARGNVTILRRQSGLPKDSVVNVSQIFAIDKSLLFERVEQLSDSKIEQVDAGLRLVLALSESE